MARADFENRVIEKTRAARSVLSQLPSWMWKCDMPKAEQLENETFIQFTEVLQVSNFFLSLLIFSSKKFDLRLRRNFTRMVYLAFLSLSWLKYFSIC